MPQTAENASYHRMYWLQFRRPQQVIHNTLAIVYNILYSILHWLWFLCNTAPVQAVDIAMTQYLRLHSFTCPQCLLLQSPLITGWLIVSVKCLSVVPQLFYFTQVLLKSTECFCAHKDPRGSNDTIFAGNIGAKQ